MHISKIFRTFAADLENKQKSNQVFNILTIRIYTKITIKKFTIMTTRQFFELPISCGFTQDQLMDIYDALYESEQVKRKNGLIYLANNNRNLMEYVKKIIEKIDDISK